MELLTQVKAYSSLKLFDIRSKIGHLLYQILFKCDLPDEGSPFIHLFLFIYLLDFQQS